MTNDVLITISGLQFDIDSSEPIEVITTGKYFLKNAKHFILYDEYLTDSPNEITKNTIKISNEQIDILKRGSSNVNMMFEKGKDTMTYYDTPFGSLLIGISTSDVQLNITSDTIEADISYDLSINYNYISECNISIKIESKAQ